MLSGERAIYVHGLWLNGGEAQVLRRRLARGFGLEVHRFHYPSGSASMGECTAQLERLVRELAAPRLHLIGHSLGGLVIYRLLERCRDVPPGRVVFLGTPAVCSHAAASAGRIRWLARLLGSCVAEELMSPCERRWAFARDLGIIAGTRRLGLGQFFAGFDEPCDGTVAVSETRLPGATDHLTLPVSHMGMLLSARVAQEVGTFLERGRFGPDPVRAV